MNIGSIDTDSENSLNLKGVIGALIPPGEKHQIEILKNTYNE